MAAVWLMYFGREGFFDPGENGVGSQVRRSQGEESPLVLFSANRLNCVGAKKLRTPARHRRAATNEAGSTVLWFSTGHSTLYLRPNLRSQLRQVLARQTNLEENSDDVQLPDSDNQELTIDELIGMHEKEQNVKELESNDPVQSED
ncbi:hypothetical protein TNCV_91281 [Trichonephila clavipes]|nr:hypothetical protein TNCV_91281 [Trichonephila clavipes]